MFNGDKELRKQRFDPLAERQQVKIAKLIGCTIEQLLSYASPVSDANRHVEYTVDSKKTDNTVTRRKIDQSSVESVAFADINSALDGSDVTDILEWSSKEWLCVLDVDYHETIVPPADWLNGLVEVHLKPKPFLWHFSKGGGLHLFYRPQGELTAEELAAVAALRFRQLDPTAGVELKRIVRGTKLPLYRLSDANAVSLVSNWIDFEGVEEKQITDYLESEGLELDHRYPHERCPINPCHSASNTDPVIVSVEGIYCFRCQGLGQAIGSRKPGWAPWASLVHTQSSGQLGTLIKNLTHFGHAKYVIKDKFNVDEYVAKVAYRAACKLYHADKPTLALVPKIFNVVTDSFARIKGGWVTVKSDYEWSKECIGILSSLPVCSYVDDEGKVKTDAAKLNLFQQPTVLLDDFGYSDLEIIHGCKIFGQHMRYKQPNRLVIEVPLKRESQFGTPFEPRYLHEKERMGEMEARAVYDAVLPRINWNYVYLLICAKGCTEGRVGLNPIILVDGPTGSSKTATILLAACILGDHVSEVTQGADTERLRSGIRDGASKGSFVAVNEFIKDATRGRNKMTEVQAIDPILNLTANSTSWKIYTGPVTLGQPPVLVFTEHALPPSIRAQTQIARRCHHVRMESENDWQTPLAGLMINEIGLLRTHSKEFTEASNSILSWVVDRFFSYPQPFSALATELGFTTLRDSPWFSDPAGLLLEFFVAVCQAPDMDGLHKKRFPGTGYKMIERDDEGDLATLWKDLNDGRDNWASSRQLSEKDWSKILGTDKPVRFDIEKDGQGTKVAVRFAQGPMQAPDTVNEKLGVSEAVREALK